MAGELWRQKVQIGKEVTAGTSVPATRVAYFRPDGTLSIERDPRIWKFQTGTRDSVRGYTNGPVMAGGSFSLPVSSSEIIELLLACVQGGVTPTTPAMATATRLWTFKPGLTLDSQTWEWNDGARDWEEAGVRINSLTLTGSVREETTLSVELFGVNLTQAALTGALTERTPDFIEGWQTKLYADAFGGTPGTTVVPGALTSWEITLNNNLVRIYTADNTLAANAVNFGELDITGRFTFIGSPSFSLTEFNNWAAGTKRLLRLEMQDETGFIETTFRRFVTFDLPGAWTAINLGGTEENTRAYEFSFQYVYDTVLAAGVQIRAQNNRSTAY